MRGAVYRVERPPLERMLRIHKELLSGALPNSTALAQALEVTVKTIHRDLEFMRSRLDLPIQYDAARHGLYYSEPVNSFPSFQITEGELVALVVAEKALQQYRGTSFEKPLLSAIKKLEQGLPETISLSLSDIHQTISFRTRAEAVLDLEAFDRLARATAKLKQLELEYRKPGQARAERRVVDPYHLANINGEWYLFAYDHLRKDIRTFVPSRIKAIKETGKTFARPRKFSLDQRLQHSFGVHSAEGEFDVTIRFSARVADYIREKKWHDSQQNKERRDGQLEVRMKLSSLKEVHRWVMGWGGEAVALRPRELVEMVRASAKALMANHPREGGAAQGQA